MDRLVVTDLTASRFDAEVADGVVAERARTVIVGGGIIGASVAAHLAALGDDDVLVLERGVVGSGTTWHAAGLVTGLRATPALTGLARYGVERYRSLEAETGVEVSFTGCGSIAVARTSGRLDELRYTAAVARQAGIDAELVTPAGVVELWPLATSEGLVGGLHVPGDGHVNPGLAALAFAKSALDRGVAIREDVRVTRILHEGGRVEGVESDRGIVRCERVVLAAGLWTRDLAATAGVAVPLHAAEHVHVRTEPVAGADPSLPVLRDLDGHFYIRHEAGRLLVGAFEPDGIPRRVDEIPVGGFARFPADWPHFAAVRARAEERVPALRTAGYERFLNAPESFTPDGDFLLGETVEVDGLFVAAGFNSQGVIFAPGAGRALAEWIVGGAPTFDASAVDVNRHAVAQNNRRYLHERTREALGRLYAMHWPHLQPTTARGLRRSPVHARLVEARACFGEATGWERADWFAPRGMEPEYEYRYGRQNWFDVVGEEHRAARETVALFDLSSFAKFEIAGPDAADVLQHLCTADVDLPVGRIRYTLVLNRRAGIELDGTVVRLDADRFWFIAPTVTHRKSLGLLRGAARGRAAAVFDATAGFATFAVMGPRSRELLRRVSQDDWSDDAQRFGAARQVEVADGQALSLRISFVGELGYELYVSADQALNVYDALVAAGEDLGLRRAGYLALDSLRSEKGYRHLGHDIGPADDPDEAGLAFAVSTRKPHPFVGRAALEERRSAGARRRTVFVALRDPDPILVHDEPLLVDGRIVGRMTSGSYGYTLGRACGIATVDADLPVDADVVVDCAGTLVPADVSTRPLFDPDGTRMRG